MRFTKYHGIGNDFILIADPDDRLTITEELAARLCDRRFGVGADGTIRVVPSTQGGELFMDYRNSDGTVGEMCGNGIRCMAVFAKEQGMTTSTELKIDTNAGLKVVTIEDEGMVRVDMGAPVFEAASIPVLADDPLNVHIDVDGGFEAACVGMGNPHAVMFVDDPDVIPLSSVGPRIEKHSLFPRMTNAEFAHVESPELVRMRVWERGSGETLACGTGACAVAVLARVLHETLPLVTVALPGGELSVEWTGSLDVERPVFMTGPATKVYEAEIDLEELV